MTNEIESIVAKTTERGTFKRDIAAYKPPVPDVPYKKTQFLAVVAQSTAYRLMLALDLQHIRRERAHVLSLRKLDAAAHALAFLAADGIGQTLTATWDALELATRELNESHAAVRRATESWLAAAQDVVRELERDVALRRDRDHDHGAWAPAIGVIDAASVQVTEVLPHLEGARVWLDAVRKRVDMDVSAVAPSKKKSPSKSGPVPDLLLGGLLLRLQNGSDLARHLDVKRAEAIVATRPKFVFAPKERLALVDDGYGTSGRQRRYDTAMTNANAISPQS